MAHRTTKLPIIRPHLRSRGNGVRFRRNDTRDSLAKQTLAMNKKVAAYCAFDKLALSHCRIIHETSLEQCG